MSQAKLEQAMPDEFNESKKLNKGNLKQMVDGMKTLLQSFQYDMNVTLEENNGILIGIRFEIKIKNLK